MKTFFLLSLLALFSPSALAKTVAYTLEATQKSLNLSGKQTVDFALVLNGSVPAPLLEFTEGDTAEILVKNRIPGQELSIHWHGLLLPNPMDGVPYVTTPPIFSGQDFVFRFPLRHAGTYWYHSHTNVQEQKGLYGGIIVHPKKKTIAYDRDIALVISDWSDENPDQILKNLRKDGDYYLYKKNTLRSWLGALQAGALSSYLKNEWDRMGGMDLSDVGYDAFLINGQREFTIGSVRPGEKLRLRFINAAASSYFYIESALGPMKVISADGIDINPVNAEEIFIGMAETYDVLYEVPHAEGSHEIRISAQDGTGQASAWVGKGKKFKTKDRTPIDYYASMDHANMAGMDHSEMGHSKRDNTDHSAHASSAPAQDHSQHNGHTSHASHANHNEHSGHSKQSVAHASSAKAVKSLSVDQLRAQEKSAFPSNLPRQDFILRLSGDMERYIWTLNDKAIHQEAELFIKENHVVRFRFVNETMMHHPMHFHGHFFRVLNEQEDYSPWKHTVDVPPHSERTIEFFTNEPGHWMLHCHNLYHLKTGMARIVKYETYTPSPEMQMHQKHDPHLHDHIYFKGMLEAATNHGQLALSAMRTWDALELRAESSKEEKNWDTEGDLWYRRWFSPFLSIVGGASLFEKKTKATAGVLYTLPLLIESQVLIDHKGDFRLGVEKKFQWTSKILSDVDFTWREKAGLEWEISLLYAPNWHWAGGLMLTDDKLGVGLQYRF